MNGMYIYIYIYIYIYTHMSVFVCAQVCECVCVKKRECESVYVCVYVCVSRQETLKGEESLYCWPPVWLVLNQLYDNWQFLFLFAKQTNPNRSNRRSTVQRYFPLSPFSFRDPVSAVGLEPSTLERRVTFSTSVPHLLAFKEKIEKFVKSLLELKLSWERGIKKRLAVQNKTSLLLKSFW